jgi:hypothetical protein
MFHIHEVVEEYCGHNGDTRWTIDASDFVEASAMVANGGDQQVALQWE